MEGGAEMPKYRNDRSDQMTIFAGGRSFLYGYTEEIDHYVYDPDLTLISHVPTARAIRPTESKLDVLTEDDLTMTAGTYRCGPFNLEMFDFEAARSFGLKVAGTGAADLTVNVLGCKAEGSGEAFTFQSTVVPISGEAITDYGLRNFDLERTEAIVLDFEAGGDMTLTEAILFL
jgi:hypothetical protein